LTDTENGDGGAIQDGDEGCRTLKRRKVAGDERPNDQRVGETCEIAKKGAAVPLLPWTWMMVAPATRLSRSLPLPFPRFTR